MSPNNHEVRIYAKKSGKWEVEHVLTEVRLTYRYLVFM